MSSRKFGAAPAALVVVLALAAAAAAVEPHAGMLRNPDVSATSIVFRYANDLWLAPREGGVATPLASPPGAESNPRFSPDGATIAFSGSYDGARDIYTLPVGGGTPFRVTHHPASEFIWDWTPDGRVAFSAWGMGSNPNVMELRSVSPTGGLSAMFPVPYGANASVSADGRWLAYTLEWNDFATWKRYRGGRATDIWLFDLVEHTSKKITDWEGTDTTPMWQGNRVFYVSDAGPEHRLNVWVYDTATGERTQVTSYSDYDVKSASAGPGDHGQGEIVYQHGPELCLLDMETGHARVVTVTIPGDRPRLREQAVDMSGNIASRDVSPKGKRVVLSARGDIWTLPAKKGTPLNLTRTSGTAEREPSWSPDGRWIAYFSDATGEYELYVTESTGTGETRNLSEFGAGHFLYNPIWSPDSRTIAFWDQTGGLFLANVEKGTTKLIDKLAGQSLTSASWSSDSNWLAWWRPVKNILGRSAIWLYDASKGEVHRVTSGVYNDSWPAFDREGKYLYFSSTRDFSDPLYADEGTTWIYTQTELLCAVPLTEDTAAPLPPEIDEEEWGDEEEGDEGEKDADEDSEKKDGEDEEKPEPVTIDLDGFERRAVALPVEKGGFAGLCVNDEGKLVYLRYPTWTEGAKSSIHLLDLEDADEEYEKTVVAGVDGFAMTPDGAKLLVIGESGMAIVEARPDQEMEDMVSTAGMSAEVDPREEWALILRDAWRFERDFFYDPGMHGVDWEAVRRQYEAMLPDCASRQDVGFLIGEMIAELNVGHAYYWDPGEYGPTTSVGLLGCDFSFEAGAYRVSRIVEGDPWDVDGRGPLSQPGVDVKEGDWLLAVNGVPLDPARDPWAAFLGLGGQTVKLTVSDKPKIDDGAREVIVELLDGEGDLRYHAWVASNRQYVDEQTGGRVGYIHVPDTSIPGQNELVRQFLAQRDKDALIIDERWNGGGQIPTRFIELLNRPATNFWIERESDDVYTWPYDSNQGPKCMLINGSAGSGGDHFPYLFRHFGLGKLIGTRTWGGLVGLSGGPDLIDGAVVTAPSFAFVDLDGTWGIEGHGVDPDIEVVDDPALMMDGKDPQLDAGIAQMLEELERKAFTPPPKPEYPDRSGMGLRLQDR
jgi:tricorn protease